MKAILTLFFICFIAFNSFGGTLKGKITDQKGEPLSFAIVYLKNTTMGTSANAEGEFALTVPDGSHVAVAQYMGFKQSSFSFSIAPSQTVTHNFLLEDEALQMKEHVVKSSEDPAVYIMRKVIARRSFHLDQIKTFQTDIYAKGVFRTRDIPKKIMGEKIDGAEIGLDSAGKGILNQFEEHATYYSQNGKEKTIIHSVRESGDPNGLGMSQFPEVINFYKNNIEISSQIAPRGMISPVSDGALNYYKFRLEGDFKEGNHTIYKISVTPKRAYEPLFTGILYIVDEEWGIQSLNMSATAKANIQLLDTLKITQTYIPVKKDEWVIKQQALFFALKVLGFDIVGNLITVYDGQQINSTIPDSIFNSKVVSEYAQGANKKDSAFWTQNRPIPLEEEEVKDYIKKDSLRVIYEDPQRLDSMRKRGNRIKPLDLVSSGYSYRGKDDKVYISTNALLSGLVNFNTVEGWNTAVKVVTRVKVDSFHYVTGKAAVRYGFANTHFNGIARLNYVVQNRSWRGRWWLFGAEGGRYVFQYNPFNPIQPLYNSISTLLYRKNYLKVYERWNATGFIDRNFGNGLRINAQFGFQQRLPLNNSTDFSYAKEGVGGFTPNMPDEFQKFTWEKHNAVIAGINISYQPGFRYTKYPDYLMPHGSNLPTFILSYQKGIPNLLNSKTNFDKWRFSIADDMDFKLLGALRYNVGTGGFLNNKYVSIPDLNHIQGNQLGVATSYLEGYQVAPYYTFSNKQPLYSDAHVEWQLRGFLTNKIPMFRKLAWYLVTGANAYYANPDLYHTEYFVGLDNIGYSIYRFLRVDYVVGWNSLNQRISAFRLGISTNGLISIKLENTNTEW
jgi:hypothetical protein